MENVGTTSFADFSQSVRPAQSQGFGSVAVVRMLRDVARSPQEIYAHCYRSGMPSLLCEGRGGSLEQTGVSIIGLRPYRHITSVGQEVFEQSIFERSGRGVRLVWQWPVVPRLEECIAAATPYLLPGIEHSPGFVGGVIGYSVKREYGTRTLPNQARRDVALPDLSLLSFGRSIVINQAQGTIQLGVCVPVGRGHPHLRRCYDQALLTLDQLDAYVRTSGPLPPLPAMATDRTITANMDAAAYMALVKRAQEKHIATGDLQQIVLSLRWEAPFDAALSFSLYRRLTERLDQMQGFHIDFGDGIVVLGASPEIMTSINGRHMTNSVLAGTRRVSDDEAESRRRADELRRDPKECAEHIILADEARNECGKIADPGTVRVVSPLAVERYGKVMHMATRVTGRLQEGLSPVAALLQVFPAGTLTGAPKLQAMRRIDEFEPVARGFYGGVVAILTGHSCSAAIFIRSATCAGGKIYWQAGAGIVQDSVPEREYDECLAKGQAMREALCSI